MLTLITSVCLVGTILFPTFMLCLCYPVSKKAALFWSNYITNRSARLVFAILRTYKNFRFEGDRKAIDSLPEQFMLISNHQSLMDIVVYLKYFFPKRTVRFVAKDSLGKVPMVGKMLRTQGHCMIPRTGGAGIAMKSIERFGNRMIERRQNPIIFPEGTRSRDGTLRPFYAAGFRRLSETVHLPVVVCALDGGWKLASLTELFRNLYKGVYRVKILHVYDSPASKEEEKKILEEAPVMIQKQLDSWRSE